MMKKASKEQIVLAYVPATGGRLPESLDNLLRGMREMIGDVSGCGSCWVSELAHLQSSSFITMSRPPMWGPFSPHDLTYRDGSCCSTRINGGTSPSSNASQGQGSGGNGEHFGLAHRNSPLHASVSSR